MRLESPSPRMLLHICRLFILSLAHLQRLDRSRVFLSATSCQHAQKDIPHLPPPMIVDGVIDQDALGLDRVYVQAKRYGVENAVSEPEIRGFSGSLAAAKANKGVFVTTSSFTQPARSFAERHPTRIVLIDGEQLTTLMIRHNVGVRTEETLYLKKVDEDFFLDE